MRHLGTTGVLIAVASITLAACGSSAGKATSDNTGVRPSTSAARANPTTIAPVTTTTANAAAGDAIAQYALSTSIAAAKQTYDDTYDYTAVTPESLASSVPSVHYAPLEQATVGVVGVLAQDKHDVLLVTKSPSGRWYCVTENNEDGVSYGVGHSLDKLNSNGECQLDVWPPPGSNAPEFGAAS
jgi:hypothetical protein